MHRLTAIDANFLYTETPTVHQHTVKVSILDPSGSPDGYNFEQVKAVMGERIHRLPAFRWKLLAAPLGLHHPAWVEDPDFDLEYHVRRIAAPAPGGDRELCEVISEISSWPLDRSKPLWQLWMVEGLEGGLVASVAKIHHVVADGVASAEMLGSFYDEAPVMQVPEVAPAPAVTPPYEPPAAPSGFALLLATLKDVITTLLRAVPGFFRRLGEAKASFEARKAEEVEEPPKPFKAPRTSFNRRLTPHRLFTFTSLDLEEAKKIRSAQGTTINDVVLAVTAGALRRYLLDRDELPADPLVAGVPVSTREEHDPKDWGNRIGVMYVRLRTDIEDPIERLQAQRREALVSKREFQESWGARIENAIELMPPIMFKAVGALLRKLSTVESQPAPSNLVMSNVPGPKSPLYIGRTKVHQFFSVGPLSEAVGLNITVWSYVDQLNFTLLSCREGLPDLWRVTDELRRSMDELTKAAGAREVATP